MTTEARYVYRAANELSIQLDLKEGSVIDDMSRAEAELIYIQLKRVNQQIYDYSVLLGRKLYPQPHDKTDAPHGDHDATAKMK